ncbi:cellulase [Ranunculus cassubicifolius]
MVISLLCSFQRHVLALPLYTNSVSISPKPSFTALQRPLQGPNNGHVLISHPANGLCIVYKGFQQLSFGSCARSESDWAYSPPKNLEIRGTYFCLKAVGLGKPAILTIHCTDSDTKWEVISDSKTYLSSNLPDGTTVCLDVDSSNNIITNKCACSSVNQTCDPGSQWFKIDEIA